jgi:hypothetical protein
MLLLVLSRLLLSLQVGKLLPRVLQRLRYPLLLPLPLRRLLLQSQQVLPQYSVLLSQQLQPLLQLSHLLVLRLPNPFNQLNYLPVLAGYRLPQHLVLTD